MADLASILRNNDLDFYDTSKGIVIHENDVEDFLEHFSSKIKKKKGGKADIMLLGKKSDLIVEYNKDAKIWIKQVKGLLEGWMETFEWDKNYENKIDEAKFILNRDQILKMIKKIKKEFASLYENVEKTYKVIEKINDDFDENIVKIIHQLVDDFKEYDEKWLEIPTPSFAGKDKDKFLTLGILKSGGNRSEPLLDDSNLIRTNKFDIYDFINGGKSSIQSILQKPSKKWIVNNKEIKKQAKMTMEVLKEYIYIMERLNGFIKDTEGDKEYIKERAKAIEAKNKVPHFEEDMRYMLKKMKEMHNDKEINYNIYEAIELIADKTMIFGEIYSELTKMINDKKGGDDSRFEDNLDELIEKLKELKDELNELNDSDDEFDINDLLNNKDDSSDIYALIQKGGDDSENALDFFIKYAGLIATLIA